MWIFENTNTLLTVINLFLAGINLFLLLRQHRFERERVANKAKLEMREKALGMMQFWNNNNIQNEFQILNKVVVELVESFDYKKCRDLWYLKEVTLEDTYSNLNLIHHLRGIHKEFKPEIRKGIITLKKPEVLLLKATTVFILNMLETIATAWKHDLADRSIIENGFIGVIVRDGNRTVLDTLREVSLIYPSLSELADALKEKRANENKIPAKKSVKEDE